MRRLPLILTIVAVSATLASCVSLPKLTANEKIALVSFTLEKSIVKEGATQDPGPSGMFVSEQDKARYYSLHQQALNAAWTEFKQAAPKIFGESRLLDIASLENNADLFAVTKNVPDISMGKDYSPSAPYLWPEKLNYVNLNEAAPVSRVAALVKADLYVSINYKAEWYMEVGLSIGGIGGGAAKMRINAMVTARDASGEYYRTAYLVGASDESVPVVLNIFDPNNIPKLFASAHKNVLKALASEVATW